MIPIIILGGSDGKPAKLPEHGRHAHPLSGYKGIDVRFDGRPMVQAVIERLAALDAFGPLYLAGPAAVYREITSGASLIDTDSSFGQNIRTALETVRSRHPALPVAFMTCDVLPRVAGVRRLLDDHRQGQPFDIWFPLVRAPQQPSALGASGWKPTYRIVPQAGRQAVEILPGHLIIVDPDALRIKFLYDLFELAYRTRNRSIAHRRGVMLRRLVFGLLYQDLRHVIGGQLPTLTWTVCRTGITASRRLRAGTITIAELERSLRRICVRAAHRRRYPERRARLPLTDELSLALDIDTEEEVRQLGGELER